MMIFICHITYTATSIGNHRSTNTKYTSYMKRSPSTWLLLKCNGHLAESIGRLDAHMCIYVYLPNTRGRTFAQTAELS